MQRRVSCTSSPSVISSKSNLGRSRSAKNSSWSSPPSSPNWGRSAGTGRVVFSTIISEKCARFRASVARSAPSGMFVTVSSKAPRTRASSQAAPLARAASRRCSATRDAKRAASGSSAPRTGAEASTAAAARFLFTLVPAAGASAAAAAEVFMLGGIFVCSASVSALAKRKCAGEKKYSSSFGGRWFFRRACSASDSSPSGGCS
mmetsp:Transcript_40591/g.65118  ORF Transcript_40591/g.65118 Transcript_40591/m.65118 type:complete len:204 (+) Transcript_40591:1769-2380(+)